MSKCLFCSKKNFLLYFLKKYYNLMYIGYRYWPIRQKIISVFYRYRPIRNLNLSVIIGIRRYEKKLISRPLTQVSVSFIYLQKISNEKYKIIKIYPIIANYSGCEEFNFDFYQYKSDDSTHPDDDPL